VIEVKITYPEGQSEKPKAYRRRVMKGMYRGMQAYLNKMSKYAANKNMNNPSSAPPSMPNLRKMTGRLWNSVVHSAVPRPLDLASDRMSGTWGSNRDYAYKHEYGGEYTEPVAAHTRRIASRSVFAGKRKTAQGIAFVKSHTRRRVYKERAMFRRAIRDKSGPYSDQAIRYAIQAVNAGRDPSAIEIEGRIS
jgi:hypothetical protein